MLDPRWHQAAWAFLKAGFSHILDGPDHLLFLLCLVIPFRRIGWTLMGVITSFTLAHSVTLIAAAYGVVPVGHVVSAAHRGADRAVDHRTWRSKTYFGESAAALDRHVRLRAGARLRLSHSSSSRSSSSPGRTCSLRCWHSTSASSSASCSCSASCCRCSCWLFKSREHARTSAHRDRFAARGAYRVALDVERTQALRSVDWPTLGAGGGPLALAVSRARLRRRAGVDRARSRPAGPAARRGQRSVVTLFRHLANASVDFRFIARGLSPICF